MLKWCFLSSILAIYRKASFRCFFAEFLSIFFFYFKANKPVFKTYKQILVHCLIKLVSSSLLHFSSRSLLCVTIFCSSVHFFLGWRFIDIDFLLFLLNRVWVQRNGRRCHMGISLTSWKLLLHSFTVSFWSKYYCLHCKLLWQSVTDVTVKLFFGF